MKLKDPYSAAAKTRQQPTPTGSNLDDGLSNEALGRIADTPFDSRLSRIVKRMIDLALAVILAVLLLPLMVVIAVAIKCVSRGPVFYGQVRLGHGGRPFRMWKFRTMVVDAEQRLSKYLSANPALRQEWAAKFKLKNDPRVLPGVGRMLRRTSLDELPQLFNVLIGEMSLVGPRPLPQYHLDQLEEDFRFLRSAMPPGITGQWQVYSRDLSSAEIIRKWDTWYIQNWSIWLDLQILSHTPWVVVSGKGTR